MKLLDFAMQMELDGKAYYERLENETPDAGLRKLFSVLAADEEKHYWTLQDLSSGVGREMGESIALEEAKSIFNAMRVEESVIAELREKKDIYLHAMQMEADSIRIYEDIAREESKGGDALVVSVVNRIIEEEKKHYNSMENIHDYIAANERMIPWRDFQGIRETVK